MPETGAETAIVGVQNQRQPIKELCLRRRVSLASLCDNCQAWICQSDCDVNGDWNSAQELSDVFQEFSGNYSYRSYCRQLLGKAVDRLTDTQTDGRTDAEFRRPERIERKEEQE
jgi:hypothetical protein